MAVKHHQMLVNLRFWIGHQLEQMLVSNHD